MTVSAIDPYVSYQYNGTGYYDFPFKIIFPSSVKVVYREPDNDVEIILQEGSDYTVEPNSDYYGGKIRLTWSLGDTTEGRLDVFRWVEYEQPVDWVNPGPLNQELIEASFDDVVMMIQQLKTYVDRSGEIITGDYVSKFGDTMTGDLTLYKENCALYLQYPAQKMWGMMATSTGNMGFASFNGPGYDNIDEVLIYFEENGTDPAYAVFPTAPPQCPQQPNLPDDLVNLAYIDTRFGDQGFVSKTGDTMTGELYMNFETAAVRFHSTLGPANFWKIGSAADGYFYPAVLYDSSGAALAAASYVSQPDCVETFIREFRILDAEASIRLTSTSDPTMGYWRFGASGDSFYLVRYDQYDAARTAPWLCNDDGTIVFGGTRAPISDKIPDTPYSLCNKHYVDSVAGGDPGDIFLHKDGDTMTGELLMDFGTAHVAFKPQTSGQIWHVGCTDDGDFAIAQFDGVAYTGVGLSMTQAGVPTFSGCPQVQTQPTGSNPNELITLQYFEDNQSDPQDLFVHRDGDVMTGELEMNFATPHVSFRPQTSGNPWHVGSTDVGVFAVAQYDESVPGYLQIGFTMQQDGLIEFTGTVRAGFTPSDNNDLCNKAYVDSVAGGDPGDLFVHRSGDTMTGELVMDYTDCKISFLTDTSDKWTFLGSEYGQFGLTLNDSISVMSFEMTGDTYIHNTLNISSDGMLALYTFDGSTHWQFRDDNGVFTFNLYDTPAAYTVNGPVVIFPSVAPQCPQDPINADDLVRMQWVLDNVGGGNYVDKGGDTMTGELLMDFAVPHVAFHPQTSGDDWHVGCTDDGDFAIARWDGSAYTGTGLSMTQAGVCSFSNCPQSPQAPATANDLTHKDYVDTQDNLRALKTGDSFTGSLSINCDTPYLQWWDAAAPVRWRMGCNSAGVFGLFTRDDSQYLNAAFQASPNDGRMEFPLAPICGEGPTEPEHLVRLQYLQGSYYNISASDARYLQKSGGELTGQLRLSFETPFIQWRDPRATSKAWRMGCDFNGTFGLFGWDGAHYTYEAFQVSNTTGRLLLPLPPTCAEEPTGSTQLVNLQYIQDNYYTADTIDIMYYTKAEADNMFLSSNGGTITGNLTISTNSIAYVRYRGDTGVDWDLGRSSDSHFGLMTTSGSVVFDVNSDTDTCVFSYEPMYGGSITEDWCLTNKEYVDSHIASLQDRIDILESRIATLESA